MGLRKETRSSTIFCVVSISLLVRNFSQTKQHILGMQQPETTLEFLQYVSTQRVEILPVKKEEEEEEEEERLRLELCWCRQQDKRNWRNKFLVLFH